MSDFEPVFLPPGAELEGRASMTFLRHFNSCPRSGFLYQLQKGRGVQTPAMVRGSAMHAILERCTRAMVDLDEPVIPPDLAKTVVNEVLAEFPVPNEEHDYMREAAYRWAGEWRIQPRQVVAAERLFVLELAGWQVRCKVDFAEAAEIDGQLRLYIADYKSGRGAPPYDEIARKRQDGSMAAKSFQLVVYALAVTFGRPVTIEPCGGCAGEGQVQPLPPTRTGGRAPCPMCGGRGRTEEPGEQVARGCQEVIAQFVYPGIEDSAELMLRRTVGLTRVEMLEYRESLEAILKRVEKGVESGDWPAVVSDAACGECPNSQACPIPAELRDFSGTINTDEQAVTALRRRHVRQKKDRALGRELRTYIVKARGGKPLRYDGRVAEIVPKESTEIKDKEGLFAALADGMPAAQAREKFVKVSKGTSFVERDLTSEEIESKEDSGGEQSEQAA